VKSGATRSFHTGHCTQPGPNQSPRSSASCGPARPRMGAVRPMDFANRRFGGRNPTRHPQPAAGPALPYPCVEQSQIWQVCLASLSESKPSALFTDRSNHSRLLWWSACLYARAGHPMAPRSALLLSWLFSNLARGPHRVRPPSHPRRFRPQWSGD
jgi:hypothetical protein